jgi:hypothetical protein
MHEKGEASRRSWQPDKLGLRPSHNQPLERHFAKLRELNGRQTARFGAGIQASEAERTGR